jgi:hypothetical protein
MRAVSEEMEAKANESQNEIRTWRRCKGSGRAVRPM